ncbi:hypothetical protein [Sulfuriroseicoccus oceanibius]|uniref:Uncharacterized protein n=1 Tax=Sulfuriroseicoccus oceanibius TaxID=2707525 RepID=A0A6B3L3M5_9BACT|nr:hypothetical protein [Sulfuriroseicoccus oceanibius]QQL46098.1 hypothetical protein G3M56_005820 [Sulfuriroseicoccus oceanibius]
MAEPPKAARILAATLFLIISVGALTAHIDAAVQKADAVKYAKSCATVDELVRGFGEPMYTTVTDHRPHEWVERSFTIDIAPDQEAHIFHPIGTNPNFIIIALSDQDGNIVSTRKLNY